MAIPSDITIHGIYEVHPGARGGYVVVNAQTGDVRSTHRDRRGAEQAAREAAAAHRQAIADRDEQD
jgi:hypothetical protein